MQYIDSDAGIAIKRFQHNNMDNAKILFIQNNNKRYVPASLCKIMNVMVVWDKILSQKINPENTYVKIPIDLLRGSSKAYQIFEKNELITLNELIKATLIISSNESAYTLALWHSGSEDKFVESMNRKSCEMGLQNTVWSSSTGLNIQAYTTVDDLLKITELFITEYTYLSNYCSNKSYTHNSKRLKNTNRLIHQHDNVKGLKTGNIVGIGSSLINFWSDGTKEYISIVLCAENRKVCFETSEWIMQNYT